MAGVLTDERGNPLWIPSDALGRDDWEQVIYGGLVKKEVYEEASRYGMFQDPRTMTGCHTLKKFRLFAPFFTTFWNYYDFVAEEDLDDYLSQYAYKLINFDWQQPLRVVYTVVNNLLQSYSTAVELTNTNPDEIKALYLAEYFYYLGPIKFAIKYSRRVPIVMFQYGQNPRIGYRADPLNWYFSIPSAAARESLIFNLYNGEKVTYPCFKIDEKIYSTAASPAFGFDDTWANILRVLHLPNVISVEASEGPPPKPTNTDMAWDPIGAIRANYLRFRTPRWFSIQGRQQPNII
jgi:hypothetical protein